MRRSWTRRLRWKSECTFHPPSDHMVSRDESEASQWAWCVLWAGMSYEWGVSVCVTQTLYLHVDLTALFT